MFQNKMKFSSIKEEELQKFGAYGKQWWNTKKSSSFPSPYLRSNQNGFKAGSIGSCETSLFNMNNKGKLIGGAGPLHDINPVRVKYFVDQYCQNKLVVNTQVTEKESRLAFDGLKVLDVGCGGGLLSESLARLGASVTAIDPSEENIYIAKEHAKLDPLTRNINYQQTTIEDIAINLKSKSNQMEEEHQKGDLDLKESIEGNHGIENEKYDIVFASEVIEHVANVPTFIYNLKQVLKPSGHGHLFITTINRTIKSYLLAIVAAERLLGIVPNETHHWNDFLTPEEVISMLKQKHPEGKSTAADVDILNTSGLIYNPLSNKWILHPHDLDVNYFIHARSRER